MSKNVIHRAFANLYHRLTRGNFGTEKWKKQFAYFGEGTRVDWPANINVGGGALHFGNKTHILSGSRIANFVEGGKITIGDGCFIGYGFSLLNASEVTIGNHVLFASQVLITSENHGIDPESELSYVAQPLVSSPVHIGDGCWIGEKVCILPGVTIGKKCIIGAASVVTKDVPDYCIAAGNPARVIKKYNFETHNWEKV